MNKIILSIMLLTSISKAELLRPKTFKDFQRATVMISDKEKKTGGTGWIIKSTPTKSFVITNGHVCDLHKRVDSMMVTGVKGSFQAERLKYSKMHDLCLIEVYTDLGVSLKVSDRTLEMGEKVVISGHPRLFPLMVTEGYLTGNIEIFVMVDIRKCNDSEADKNNMYCKIWNGVPVIKSYESRMTSAFIAGGNSGSAVYDASGEVVGVAFAGSEEGYSQSVIVPLEYVKNFVKNEIKTLDWQNIASPKEQVMKIDSTKSNLKPTAFTVPDKKLFYPSIQDSILKEMTDFINKNKK